MGMCDCGSLENVVICSSLFQYMSTVMKTPTFCTCENKGEDQHRSIGEADQRFCFRCNDAASEVAVIQKSQHNNSECTCNTFICSEIMLTFH